MDVGKGCWTTIKSKFVFSNLISLYLCFFCLNLLCLKKKIKTQFTSPSWVFSLLRLAFIFSYSTKDNLIILHEDNVTYIAVFSLLRLAFIFSSSTKDNLIILHEDNVTYIAHIKGYIKHNRVKHKSSKFFYSHKLPKNSKN